MEEEVKVSELAEASVINDEDLIMTVQNSVNKKATFSKILSRIGPLLDGKVDKEMTSYTGDLNDLTTVGFYFASYENVTNAPEANVSYYILVIKRDNNYVLQIAYNLSNVGYAQEIYIRQKYYGTWIDWKRSNIDIVSAQANTNFNDLTTTGSYFFGSVPTGNNKPASTGLQSGVLEVFKHPSSSLISQRYTNFDGSKIYVRGSYQNGWSAWGTITPV